MRAVLAHPEHDQAALFFWSRGVGRKNLAGAGSAGQKETNSKAQEHIGGLTEPAGRLLHRPNIAEIGKRNQERDFVFPLTQDAHEFALRFGAGCFRGGRREDLREPLFRGRIEGGAQALGLALREAEEIGRAGENTAEEVCGIFREGGWSRSSPVEGGHQPVESSAAASGFIIRADRASGDRRGSPDQLAWLNKPAASTGLTAFGAGRFFFNVSWIRNPGLLSSSVIEPP